jgi:hypothetical protein
MPTAPQAKFQFVATGDDVVNAQIQQVIDKLTAMKGKAQEAGQGASEGMLSANESVKLLSESLDLKIPRALEKVISGFQSLSGIIAGAGIAGGLIAAGEVLVHIGTEIYDLYNKWLNVDEAVDQYNKTLGEAVTKSIQNVNSIEQAGANLQFFNSEMKKYSDQQAGLNRTNSQAGFFAFLDPSHTFQKADEKDAATNALSAKSAVFQAQVASQQQQLQLTTELIGAEKQLSDTRLEGLPKILADEQSDINLANAKLTNMQALIVLENQRRAEYNATSHKGGDVPMIPDNAGQSEHDTTVFYAKAQALAEIAKEAREAQTTLLSFNDMLANANRQAGVQLQDDPYEKQLQELDSYWQKVIDETDKGAADKFKILQKDGINTTALQKQLDDTDYNLLSAHLQARTDLIKKQQLAFLSGGLGNQSNIPKDLFVTATDTQQMAAADRLLKQINADLQDESAQEALLKDQATTSGMTQIDLENKLQVLRTTSANNIQGLVTQLQSLGAAMLNGLGNPTVIAQADKLAAKIDALRVKTQTWGIELKKEVIDQGQEAFVGIISGSETAAQAFQKMTQSILADLAKIIYQMYVVKLLNAAIGGISNLFGGGGGNVVDMTSQVNLPSIIPHAMGGNVSPGQTYLVGERGPELLNIGASGSVTPNNMIGRGGAMPVQVNIHNYGQPMSQSQTSRFDGEKMIVDVVVKNMQNNGAIRQSMKG